MATKSKEYFEQMFPDTAGIDIGSARHSVSVPADRDAKSIPEFSAITFALEAIARGSVPAGFGAWRRKVPGSTGFLCLNSVERRLRK